MKLLLWIKNNLILSILLSMLFGIVIGYFFDVSKLKNLILPLTFLLVYPMLVTLNFHSLLEKTNYKLQASTQIINFVVFPLLAYAVGYAFFLQEPYLRLGLLLIALLPTSGMSISWTAMAKGNVHEVIKMVVIGLMLGAVLTPLFITVLLGTEVDVPFMTIFTQIIIVVFIPLIVAYITQKILMKRYSTEVFHKQIKPKFPLFSTLGVVIMIFVAVSLKAKVIVNNPELLLRIIFPLLLFYFLMFAVSIFFAKTFFSNEEGIALVNGSFIRNLSLALAIVLSAFPNAGIAAVLIAIAYVLQVQIAAWNIKFSKYIFKK
ncbi:MAG: arsenic resistance protein [Bacilli bacterium]|nr:arsenic resistance protein [Bacilli bacterium]